MQHFMHFTVTPIIGFLFLGILPFLFVKRNTALIISYSLGALILLFIISGKISSVASLINDLFIFFVYFLTLFILFRTISQKQYFLIVFIILLVLMVSTYFYYYIILELWYRLFLDDLNASDWIHIVFIVCVALI
jgi:hypothetical protein